MTIHDRGFDSGLLDLVLRDGDAVIYHGNETLKTRGGRDMAHENERLLKHIITDLQVSETDPGNDFSAVSLFEFMTDRFAGGDSDQVQAFLAGVENDPLVMLKSGNRHESGDAAKIPVDEAGSAMLFNLRLWNNAGLVTAMNDFIAGWIRDVEGEESASPLVMLIEQVFSGQPVEGRAVLARLSASHGAWQVLPVLLVLGKITAAEYAKGLLSLGHKPGADAVPGFGDLYKDALKAREFLSYFTLREAGEESLKGYIAAGENDQVEFKSTLRWDIRAGKTNPAIERACLKTMAAFLNSAGGVLLIGIRDDGSVEGIETDKFANEDKFLLHLWTLIRTCLGRDVSPFIRTRLEKSAEKSVCIVQCLQASRPVFLRQPGFDEEFYIRVGPGSTAMDISEALKYIQDRFPGK